ncbi:hypothetical protein PM082_011033 [Marasmius tenuissimus]|nr:hypothetical protein PM082_011033 [Marasmius tenuissimus]
MLSLSLAWSMQHAVQCATWRQHPSYILGLDGVRASQIILPPPPPASFMLAFFLVLITEGAADDQGCPMVANSRQEPFDCTEKRER